MKSIKRVDSYSLGKVFALYNLVFSFIIGVILTIIFFLGLKQTPQFGVSYGIMFALMVLIAGPIISSLITFVIGMFSGYLYNKISGKYGGIKLEID